MKGHVLICGPAEPSQILLDTASDARYPTGLGGVPVNLLARALLDRDWKVTVVSTSKHVSDRWSHTEGNATVVLVPFRPRPRDHSIDLYGRERSFLTEEIIQSDADVVHAHWTYEFALAALESGRRTLVTAHDSPMSVLRRMPDPYRLIRAAMAVEVRRSVSRLTAVSPLLAGQWRRQMLFSRPIPVIPNLVETPPAVVATSPRSNLRVVSIGQGTRLKNVRALVEAWPLVRTALPDAELVLAGPGLDADGHLAQRARERGESSASLWMGEVDRQGIYELLHSASVLVHPSLLESQGQVLLEAMACGVPIVAGRESGAVPWTVGREAAALVDVRSPEQLAEATLRILMDVELRARMGSAGVARVREMFAPDVVVPLYEEQYDLAGRS